MRASNVKIIKKNCILLNKFGEEKLISKMSIASAFSRYVSQCWQTIRTKRKLNSIGQLNEKISFRLCLQPTYVRSFTTTPAIALRVTPILCAEPLKKKKKIDPAIIKHREDRRRKKIEKQIRRLEKHARQLKPIDELEVPLSLIDEKE